MTTEPKAPPAVYVDSLESSPGSKARTFRTGTQYCHLTAADFSPEAIEALHMLAAKIGLKPAWFQASPPASWPHYDLVASKRPLAIAAGAVEETRLGGGQRRWAIRTGKVPS